MSAMPFIGHDRLELRELHNAAVLDNNGSRGLNLCLAVYFDDSWSVFPNIRLENHLFAISCHPNFTGPDWQKSGQLWPCFFFSIFFSWLLVYFT